MPGFRSGSGNFGIFFGRRSTEMDNYYGKLVLMNPDGPEQEYELSKTSVTLGRSMTNDIILDDNRISRSHARLEM